MKPHKRPTKPSSSTLTAWREVQAPRPGLTYPPRRTALESEARRATNADELARTVGAILKLDAEN